MTGIEIAALIAACALLALVVFVIVRKYHRFYQD